ncbi:venom metalloproteinase antarease-like TtrivMP_A [Ixodes scapularis]
MGYAFIAAACGESRVGLGEDKANTFLGVRIMAHELGHLMGCPHDGDPTPPNLGGPGSTSCPFADGYLMSYYTHNMNQYTFSSCCKKEISLMARLPQGKCLHIRNAISKLKQMDENLPGEGVSKTTQCKRAFPKLKKTRYMKNRPIVNCAMQCFIPKRVYGYDTHIAVALTDGTTCNKKGHVCINGRCRTKKRKYLF